MRYLLAACCAALGLVLVVSPPAWARDGYWDYDSTSEARKVRLVGSSGGGGTTFTFTSPLKATNCAANGTTSVSVTAGAYKLLALDEATFLCDSDDGGSGTDCATLGTPLVVGTQFPDDGYLRVTATTTFYCRSAGATGDVYFLPATP